MFDDENIYSIPIGENGFGNKVSSLKALNTDNNEGSITFSDSRDFLIYTSCKMNFKKNSCDLFISYFDGMKFNLLKDEWKVSKDKSVNYIGRFIKN